MFIFFLCLSYQYPHNGHGNIGADTFTTKCSFNELCVAKGNNLFASFAIQSDICLLFKTFWSLMVEYALGNMKIEEFQYTGADTFKKFQSMRNDIWKRSPQCCHKITLFNFV